jgi:FMN phosphatase YigB (HAD superfamily)
MSTTQPTPRAEFPANLWQRDEPLRRAAELIEQSNGLIRAVSFDFFDTIVWRLVSKPIDAFCEIGQRLREQQILKDPIQPQDYEVIRKLAEWKARERQQLKDNRCEDISIAEIYENLNAVIKEPAKAIETEHGVECDVCMLNPGMASFIRHIHGLGIKVLIVSDIYFSADHLRGILSANHFDPAIFDCVLTSCDAGVCKGTGNLFKHALKHLGLQANQVMHIGDNYGADIVGARKARIRGCHYPQFTNAINTILEREKFLLGAQSPVFSINSLRMLAARNFPQDTDEGQFARMGALLLGPVLTRFAAWACDQYVAAGVRKVGAFMREGELFGELLQREADVRGLDLEIKPLYVNRKATALASLGKLTADGLIDWLARRSTLPIKTILKHLGLPFELAREIPFSVEEKADTKERILKLAEFLFTPKNAGLIEAKSREEREKVMDYLKPWLDSGDIIGLCDIGYNASAHTQLKRVLDMAGNRTHLVGCYLVTGEGSAARILESLDVRHYLGSFGRPAHLYYAFLRSPAIIEQCFTAPIGTTLGYERQADGTVTPVLDKVLFNDAILRRQRAFKEGVRHFQNLWHSFVAAKPEILGGKTEVSQRVLADIDRGLTPILGRVAAFPLPSEVSHFGSLPLDDQYFADSFKPMCSEADCDKLRKIGYLRLLGEAGVHWPQGIHELTNRHAAANFFSYGKAMLHCNPEKDNEGLQAELTIVLPAGRNPTALRECLKRVKSISDGSLQYEVFVLVTKDDKQSLAVLQEFPGEALKLHVLERTTNQSPVEVINKAADLSTAPFLMFLDEGTLLPAGWDTTLLATIRTSQDMGMVFPRIIRGANVEDPLAATWRGLIVRRLAFIESLGLNEELAPVGAMWQLALNLQESNWKTEFVPQAMVEAKFAETAISLASYEKSLLKKRFANFEQLAKEFSAKVTTQEAGAATQRASSGASKVDWIGSFLDAGSLSHVNRALTQALANSDTIQLNCVNGGAETSPSFKQLAGELAKAPSAYAEVTVRHAWPPNWTRPKSGKLVVVQPWEFGSLPEQWVRDLVGVDEVWVPSQYVRNVYIDSGVPVSKVFVVPNGVDTAKFNPQAAPMKLPTVKKFKFLFVGGTILRKGPDVLLKAYLEAFTAADDVCLVIKDFGGKTVYAGQTFEEKIRAAQAQPNAPQILYLNDELAPDQLPGLYRACDCFVLPYRGEGYGLPVVEAMACGLPVMVTAMISRFAFRRNVRLSARKSAA